MPSVESRRVTLSSSQVVKKKAEAPTNIASTTSASSPTNKNIDQNPPDSILIKHQIEYFKNIKKLDYEFSNIYETVTLKAKLKKHRIPCVKYNYSLD